MRGVLSLQEVGLLCFLTLFSGHILLCRPPLCPRTLYPRAEPKYNLGWLGNPCTPLTNQGHQPSFGPGELGHSGYGIPAGGSALRHTYNYALGLTWQGREMAFSLKGFNSVPSLSRGYKYSSILSAFCIFYLIQQKNTLCFNNIRGGSD